MMYCPEHQYRCTIIRGKSQNEMEDLLPIYLDMVHKYCPCSLESFKRLCQDVMAEQLFKDGSYDQLSSSHKKTVRNHITEIAGKLLGLYYVADDKIVHETEACSRLIQFNDNISFFRNLCYNFQFPNGLKSAKFIKRDLDNGISFKPFCFIVALLIEAEKNKSEQKLTKQEIGYYVLNNLDVLRGGISCQTVYQRILDDRKNGIDRPKLSGSKDWQHIKEQFNILELTGLVCMDSHCIWLNKDERKIQSIFAQNFKATFNVQDYYEKGKIRSTLAHDWGRYYGSWNSKFSTIRFVEKKNATNVNWAKNEDLIPTLVNLSTVEIGDRGERLVYNYEVGRIKHLREPLQQSIQLVSKEKGLGYDIVSVDGEKPGQKRYIEVKSSIRYSEPMKKGKIWNSSLNLTVNEWQAAEKYGENFYVYIVYFFVKSKTASVYLVHDPFALSKQKKILIRPVTYRMNYDSAILEKMI